MLSEQIKYFEIRLNSQDTCIYIYFPVISRVNNLAKNYILTKIIIAKQKVTAEISEFVQKLQPGNRLETAIFWNKVSGKNTRCTVMLYPCSVNKCFNFPLLQYNWNTAMTSLSMSREDYKNLPPLCTGTGKSTLVSKDAANLWHEGGFPCPCTKVWLIIFLLPLSISIA